VQVNVFLSRMNGERIGFSVLGIFVIDKNTILTVNCFFSDIFLIIIYLSHCYSVAWDRLINHLRLSVSVSVVAPTAAFYYSIFMKFCTVISGPEKQDRVCLQ